VRQAEGVKGLLGRAGYEPSECKSPWVCFTPWESLPNSKEVDEKQDRQRDSDRPIMCSLLMAEHKEHLITFHCNYIEHYPIPKDI
jgi:hypothetical protein